MSVIEKKSFLTLTPVVNVINISFFITDIEAMPFRMFVLGKLFQPGLI
jgi:hypothetical protein